MSEDLSTTGKSRRPSVVALLFGIWALVAPLGYSWGMVNGDGDLPRHIILGRHILGNGVVFPDVFSHTKPGEIFFAYEWLSEVILAGVEAFGGLAGVAVLTGLMVAISVALVAYYLRGRLEAGGILVVGTLIVVLTYPHWIARPHLFSFIALPVLLFLTRQIGTWKGNLSLVVLFSLWANLHPGFLYGLAVLFAFLFGDMLDDFQRGRIRANSISAASAMLGTFITPFGWRLHENILHHLRDSRAFGFIEEFQPPSVVSPYGFLFFILVAAIIWLLSVRDRRPPYSVLLPFLASLFAALVAVRNVPLLGLFAVPLLLASTSDVIHGWRWKPLEKPRRVMEADDRSGILMPYVVVVLIILGALVGTSGRVGPIQLVEDSFSNEAFPVEAVARAREAGFDDRTLFSEYRWGGFILHAWPEQKIYIDGMANFFGSELMEEYLSIWLTQEGWVETMEERGIDLLILPTEGRLSQEARLLPGWEVWFEDSTASVLLYEGEHQEDA